MTVPIVRQFQPNDMFLVIRLASETLTEHYNPSIFNYFYETFAEGFWIAEELGKIVGFIIGVKTTSDTTRILMLAISEKKRKKGLGSALLNNFLDEMTRLKITCVDLEVRKDNNQAVRLYKKHGFEIINTLPIFYQNGQDAYIMRRYL